MSISIIYFVIDFIKYLFYSLFLPLGIISEFSSDISFSASLTRGSSSISRPVREFAMIVPLCLLVLLLTFFLSPIRVTINSALRTPPWLFLEDSDSDY